MDEEEMGIGIIVQTLALPLQVPEQLEQEEWVRRRTQDCKQTVTVIKFDAHITPLRRALGDQFNQEEPRPIEPQIFI